MSHDHDEPKTPFGLLAEFRSPDDLLAAAKSAYAEGYRKLEAYSPFPVHGVSAAIGFPKDEMRWVILIGAVLGAITAYVMQYFSAVIHYPINVGGRPLHSWPSFIPITFELTVLGGASAAVFGMIILNGLPTYYHPVFNVPGFALASRDRFFLLIESIDPKYAADETMAFLEGMNPVEVNVVPR